MKNCDIVFGKRIELAKEGKIGLTGKKIKCVNRAGETVIIDEPEEIHTYAAWKSIGYQVMKGQKAIAKFTIWKYAVKKGKEDDGEEEKIKAENMFMKEAAFFSMSQVEKIAKMA